MGHGSVSADELRARSAYRASSGTAYAYSAAMHAAPAHDRKIHESLDPKKLNSLNEKVRECLDSDDHPLTIPCVVGFDQTGSMSTGPRILTEKLATLKGITLRAGLTDLSLCFSCYGDAENHEVGPCQVGQFENSIAGEEWLNNLFLEGDGGGNGGETCSLLLYYLAVHTRLDCLDKRGRRGYAFITGDEISLPATKRAIKTYIGEDVESDLDISIVCEMVKEKFDTYFLLVNNGSAKAQGSLAFWSKHLGADHVIVLENLETVPEVISLVISNQEGSIATIDDGIALLKAEGVDDATTVAVGNALAAYVARTATVSPTATTTGTLPAAMSAGDMEDL